LVAQDDPLDQYLVQHPADLFSRPPEAAVVDPTNPYILEPHLACAAREQPLTQEEVAVFGEGAIEASARLVEEGILIWRRGLLCYRGGQSPHQLVDVRSASGSLFAIVDRDTGALLGTVDESRAFHDVHPGAIYLHQGEQYEVAGLDLDRKVAVVARSDAEYYTQPLDQTDIEVVGVIEAGRIGPTPTLFGEVRVTRQVVGYQRKAASTTDVIDLVQLDLPAQILATKALWWLLPKRELIKARITPGMLPGAAHAAEHAAIGLLPLVATCDRWDVGGVSTPLHPDTGAPTIFIYDGYPGGAGIAERGYRAGRRLLEATFETVRQCPCSRGCPSCVVSPKCGNGNEPLDKQGAVALLAAMIERPWG